MTAIEPGEVRRALIDALEGRYYSGATAGQLWLRDLSAYLQSLPEDDVLFRRLAAAHEQRGFGRYLEIEARPLLSSLDPAGWFGGYLDWANGRAAVPASRAPATSDPQTVHDGL